MFVQPHQGHYKKNEKLSVPAIAGLRQEVREKNGIKTVVYLANPDGPYGLKVGVEAGWFDINVVSRPQIEGKVVELRGATHLVTEVYEKLLTQVNTPERIKNGTWLIVLPLHTDGSQTSIVSVDVLNPSANRSVIVNGLTATHLSHNP